MSNYVRVMDGLKSNASGQEFKLNEVITAELWNPKELEPEKMGGFNFSKEDKSQHPANTVGEPKDIANMVLFLCSNKAKFITGENINIDGGMSKLMVYHNDYGWQYKED